MTSAALDQSPDKLRQALSQTPAPTGPGLPPAPDVDKIMATLKEQRQFFNDTINQFIIARKDPLPARLKADEALNARVEEAKSKQYVLVSTMVPALGRVTTKEASGLARLRLAQTALALEQFRLANANRYPDALTELSPKFLPAVPEDPFDGQPLRYRKAGEGYLIYSVGPDLKDDGGARKPGTDDLSFVVVRPARAS
jgi:hypothetical protein